MPRHRAIGLNIKRWAPLVDYCDLPVSRLERDSIEMVIFTVLEPSIDSGRFDCGVSAFVRDFSINSIGTVLITQQTHTLSGLSMSWD